MKFINLDISSAGRIVSLTILLYCSFISSSPLNVQAAEGDLEWAFGFGQSGQSLKDVGQNIFVDSVGNVYATGFFRGTVDFDPGPGKVELISVAGNKDIFITKMNSSGSLIWAKNIGGFSDDEGWGITVDASGNVITTGYFVGTVDFDPGDGIQNLSNSGSSDIFISKLDSNGNYVGAWAMGGNQVDYGFGVFTDSSGNIYTTGYFMNIADFDPAEGTTYPLTSASVNVADIFISKLTSSGSFDWAKRIGGTADDEGLGISRYSSGHIYITGWFQGTNVDFDLDNTHTGNIDILTSSGFDIFVLKLTDDGSFIWAKSMGGVSDDRGQAVSVDALGNVYTTGWFVGTADFDPADGANFPLTSSGGVSDADIFVSKLNSGGSFVWAKSMGAASSADVGYGIFADPSGNVYTTGVFNNTADFDPGVATTYNLDSDGGTDIFISKLDSSGNFVWAKRTGGTSDDYGYDIFVDRRGAVYATGYFQGTADFDPGPGTQDLVSGGSFDIFISKLEGRVFPWAMFLPAIIGNKKY